MAPETRARLVRVATVVVVLVVLAGFTLAVRHAKTGDPEIQESGPSDVWELQQPANGDHVLRQAQIGIDLLPGWTGVLIVNGTEIPEDQLQRVPALYQVFFTPAEGAEIEQLPPGRNCVSAIVWRVESTRADAHSPIDWCFFVD